MEQTISVEHMFRLLAFDLGVASAGGVGLLGMQLLAEAGFLGVGSGLGEQLGISGLIALVTAVMMVRREVNRVLKGIEKISGLELRLSNLEIRVDNLAPIQGAISGRHRRHQDSKESS